MSKKRLSLALMINLILLSMLLGCKSEAAYEEDVIADENRLIVYTSHKAEIYEPIIKEFEERSGIWVQVECGGTNELLERIAVNGEYGCADVMFGGGVDSLQAYTEYFEPYRVTQYDKLDKRYASKTDSYTVFSKLPIVFIYNEKLVISAGTPRSFEELFAPRWKGHIAFANPVTSGSSYTALATMIQVLGKEQESDITQAFLNNLSGDICEDSGDVIEQVISGKKSMGITLESTALKRIKTGADIGIVYPRDGTSTVPDGCAILKNAPHFSNAALFMEFMVSDDVQHLLEDRLFRRSVRTDIESYEPVVEMDYDIEYAMDRRSEILSPWMNTSED